MLIISGRLERSVESASAYDLFSHDEGGIPSGQRKLFSTGVVLKGMPSGLVGHVCGTRQMSMMHGVMCAPLMLDGLDTGEIMLMLYNTGNALFRIKEGDRIGQLVFSLALHPQMISEKQDKSGCKTFQEEKWQVSS